MRTAAPSRQHRFLLLAATLLLVDALLVHGLHLLDRQPVLAVGVLADGLLVMPLLFLLLHRGQPRSPWALVRAALLGLSVAWLIVPKGALPALGLLKQLAWAGASGAECWLLFQLVRLLLQLRREGGTSPEQAIRRAVRQTFGNSLAARALTLELMTWYLALFSWRRQAALVADGQAFSYGQRDGSAGMVLVLAWLQWLEPPFLHLLIALWSKTAAWAFTGLSVYGFFFLLGLYRAIRLRPITLDAETLHVRCGLLGDLDLPRSAICSATPQRGVVARRAPGNLVRVPPTAMPNVCITLATPLDIPRLIGAPRRVERLYLAVDHPAALIAALSRHPAT